MNTSLTKSRRKLPEGDHELGELLLVELGDGPEHALPRHPPELGVSHRLLGHAHDLSWGQQEDNRKQAVMGGNKWQLEDNLGKTCKKTAETLTGS
jgi:hypothetical protein